MGFNFHLLDVGGGFSCSRKSDGITFEKIASVLGSAIDKYFPSDKIHIIAEPGRYYAAPAFTIATNIIARRIVRKESLNNEHFSNMDSIQDGALVTGDHPSFMCKYKYN